MPLESVNVPVSAGFPEAVPSVSPGEEKAGDSPGTRCAIFAFGAVSSLAVFFALAPLMHLMPEGDKAAVAAPNEVSSCASLIPRFLRTFAPLPP